MFIDLFSIPSHENAFVYLYLRADVWYVYTAARTRHIRLIFHTRFYTRSNYNNNRPPRLVLRSRDWPVPTYPPWTSLVLWNWFNIFISLCKSTMRRDIVASTSLRCVSPFISSPFIDFKSLEFILQAQSEAVYSIELIILPCFFSLYVYVYFFPVCR